MKWGIIGALDAEIALILEHMELERTQEICGSKYYCGKIGSEEVVAVCCSIGTINAAFCATVIIRELGAQVVVNVGIAGSSSKDLGVLDVVVAQDVTFHDADLDIISKYYPFKKIFTTDDTLRSLCIRSMESMSDRSFKYRVGRIATGDQFVNDRETKNRIVQNFHPLCIEMEGAAIGQVAHMNNIPFLVIRTLSDDADDAADAVYDNFLERAAHNSARILLEMLHLSKK